MKGLTEYLIHGCFLAELLDLLRDFTFLLSCLFWSISRPTTYSNTSENSTLTSLTTFPYIFAVEINNAHQIIVRRKARVLSLSSFFASFPPP